MASQLVAGMWTDFSNSPVTPTTPLARIARSPAAAGNAAVNAWATNVQAALPGATARDPNSVVNNLVEPTSIAWPINLRGPCRAPWGASYRPSPRSTCERGDGRHASHRESAAALVARLHARRNSGRARARSDHGHHHVSGVRDVRVSAADQRRQRRRPSLRTPLDVPHGTRGPARRARASCSCAAGRRQVQRPARLSRRRRDLLRQSGERCQGEWRIPAVPVQVTDGGAGSPTRSS